ncbi:MAG: GAF domain-containing sensor histidine kinase [Sphingobacteriaceae bacterium]|nr:MAG: GAF domain-containing sensor histidine kinase [Sphingobacteriaceae bacterium]
MINNKLPVPFNEMDRIINLSQFDLDFSDIENEFEDLTLLAAKIAGTSISVVNLVDSYTQWTIAGYGFRTSNSPREESVCQYTIMSKDALEINDLSEDNRFKNRTYVKENPDLRYYLGIPLTTEEGHQIGALCVLDTLTKEIDPEKVALLTIIAREIVKRLKTLSTVNTLRKEASAAIEIKKRIVHDIRGPIGGIMGLSQLLTDQGKDNTLEEVLEFSGMIHQSASSILELANEILSSATTNNILTDNQLNLIVLREKLEKLYTPQAIHKNIDFKINVGLGKENIPFSKDKILQIAGNLITNAIKFTPQNGFVMVDLNLITDVPVNCLTLVVKDSGIGLSNEAVKAILSGTSLSGLGTNGEQGFGFGLTLVKHLIDNLQGTMHIISEQDKGTVFTISIPQQSAIKISY